MIYSYKTPVGTFVIKQSRGNPQLWELWIGDECHGSYTHPQNAASDVFTHTTDFYAWDVATHLEASENLADWKVS